MSRKAGRNSDFAVFLYLTKGREELKLVFECAFMVHIYFLIKICHKSYVTSENDVSKGVVGHFVKILIYIGVFAYFCPLITAMIGTGPNDNCFFLLSNVDSPSDFEISCNLFVLDGLIALFWTVGECFHSLATIIKDIWKETK